MGCWVFWRGFLSLHNILMKNQNCFFTWGVTGLAPPELLILCWRSGALGFVGFDFTWISHITKPSFFPSFEDLDLIGICWIGLDFVRICGICFHFIWIWGGLWNANSWWCPLSLFRSRLFHSNVVRHPVYLRLSRFQTLSPDISVNLSPFQGELPSLVIDDEDTVLGGSRLCVSLEHKSCLKQFKRQLISTL